jgi:carboxyl-terminal processing protease
VLLWTAPFLPPLHAAEGDPLPPARQGELLRQAQQSEQQGHWAKACECYEQLLAKDRTLTDVKDRYLQCLRRAQQVKRHQDATFRQQVLDLPLHRALEVYGEILTKLNSHYVDRAKVEMPLLFKQGLEELRCALGEESFCQEYLPGSSPEVIRQFREQLPSAWGNSLARRPQDVQAQARDLALAAQRSLGLKPSATVLELACGACSGLDEYTAYLTPGQYEEISASLKGEIVGIGIEVSVDDLRLVISQVLPGSPAEAAGLKAGDRIVRINKSLTQHLPAEAAAEQLRGEAGSLVELEVATPGADAPRVLKLTRQAIAVTSVSEPRFLANREAGMAYLQIVGFQDTTLQELDTAIAKLQMAGVKVLILDLRGNAGGLFDVAVKVVERFMTQGVIVSTRGQLRIYNTTYEAHGPGSLAVPLVVLVDGETASSAEMVAGALKDNQRGTLVGQTTFGKGTIQKVRRLTSVAAGLRITVARFYSPLGHSFSGTGVVPHRLIDRPAVELSMDIEQDPQVRAAMEVARELALGR